MSSSYIFLALAVTTLMLAGSSTSIPLSLFLLIPGAILTIISLLHPPA